MSFIRSKECYEQRANCLTERIVKHRKDKGLTISQLAARMGISRSLLYNHENASCSMSLITFLRICDALDAKPEKLIKDLPFPPQAELPSTINSQLLSA